MQSNRGPYVTAQMHQLINRAGAGFLSINNGGPMLRDLYRQRTVTIMDTPLRDIDI